MTTKLTTRQRDKLIEAAQNSIEFTVTGSGPFPTDMLRYDLCWPASEKDSTAIDGRYFGETALPHRSINLKGLKTPTIARWRSFGWTVLPLEGEFSR
jgi:hypothetical protein